MIEVKDLRKSYGSKKVLNGVSFTADKGNHLFDWYQWFRKNNYHECDYGFNPLSWGDFN